MKIRNLNRTTRKQRFQRAVRVCGALAVLTACGPSPGLVLEDANPFDAAPRDASSTDAGLTDVGLMDVGHVDAAPYDGTVVDAQPVDGSISDGSMVGDAIIEVDAEVDSGTLFPGWSTAAHISGDEQAKQFGASIAFAREGQRTVMVVGDYGGNPIPGPTPTSGTAGAVSIFEESPAGWQLAAQLERPAGAVFFGETVQVSSAGNVIVANTWESETDLHQNLFVFRKAGDAWSQGVPLPLPQDVSLYYARAFAMNDDASMIEVNDFQSGPDQEGAVYLFQRDANSPSGFAAPTILPRPASLEEPNNWGSTLALSANGRFLAVRDSGRSETPTARGVVFVYEKTETGWSLPFELSRPSSPINFGREMAFSGDGSKLVVADQGGNNNGRESTGRVRIYDRTSQGWELRQELLAPEGARAFGNAIALSYDGSILAVGDLPYDLNPRGTLYILQLRGERYEFSASPLTGRTPHRFSEALAISDDNEFVAAEISTAWRTGMEKSLSFIVSRQSATRMPLV